jgi:hypothetical protein
MAKPLRRLSHGRFVVVDHRLSARRLIACHPQRIERQRVRVRRRLLFLQQAAEHPDLNRVEALHGPGSLDD